MPRRQNPSFFSGTASDGDFLTSFRSPQPQKRRGNLFSFVIFHPLFPTLFTSTVVVAILYMSFLLQGVLSSALLLIAAFFLGIAVYSLNRITDLKEDSVNMPDGGRFFQKNRDYLLFASIESINIAVVLAFFSDPYAIIVILFAFSVSVFYGIGTHRLRLKNILLLKNITIAGTMATTAIVLPFVVHANVAFIVLMATYFIFLNIFIEGVLLDVRDIEGDRKAGVRTIPASLGRKRTRNVLLLMNTTLVVWVAIALSQPVFYPFIFVFILAVLYGYWSILRFTRASAKISRPSYSLVTGKWIILALYATPFALGWVHIL